ncbi:lipopolysaccharide kinase InaA family protein [Halopseudomonas phragmitis]|uniref:Heptose kinase n=1 Tax=Halopseudomonas phragmitis TaxID=1931241 RepID=A0A1V0B4F6_9GAMM|nr:lipopolysaccharide kinase InaA family protein [Halopseudomonas phragmitis]AQZ94813.1 heptose kinase [Halopseudomonas phragmitis]
MIKWTLNPEYATGHSGLAFADLDSVFALEGEFITRDPLSTVHRVWIGDRHYYLKRYHAAGKHLRRYLGRPRVVAEWENLLSFKAWGIPAATVVGFGMERRAGLFVRGAMITEALDNTTDLARLAEQQADCFKDPVWVRSVCHQVAHAARMMHDQRFVHNDFKWRNILVDAKARVYLIDCPAGAFWWGPMLRYRIIKDLACLDKLGKLHFTRSQRLRFYRDYSGKQRLDAADKHFIRRVLKFFEGRE